MKHFLIPAVLLVLAIFWSGCNQPAGTGGQGAGAISGGKVDCTMLTVDDVKATLGVDKAEESMLENTPARCIKQVTGWKGQMPSNTVVLSVIETTVTGITLDPLCKDKPSLGLGDYVSCNFSGQISFGKGKYVIFLTCPQCSADDSVKLARIMLGKT